MTPSAEHFSGSTVIYVGCILTPSLNDDLGKWVRRALRDSELKNVYLRMTEFQYVTAVRGEPRINGEQHPGPRVFLSSTITCFFEALRRLAAYLQEPSSRNYTTQRMFLVAPPIAPLKCHHAACLPMVKPIGALQGERGRLWLGGSVVPSQPGTLYMSKYPWARY